MNKTNGQIRSLKVKRVTYFETEVLYDIRERALHMFRSESYWLITTVSFGTCLAQLKEPCKWAGLQTPASRRTLPQTQFAGIAGVRLLH